VIAGHPANPLLCPGPRQREAVSSCTARPRGREAGMCGWEWGLASASLRLLGPVD